MDQPARGGVRGCLGNQEKEPLRNPGLDTAFELSLGLHPSLTGNGWGHGFVNSCLTWLDDHEYRGRMVLSVASFNMRAIKAYQAVGFVKIRDYAQMTNGGTYDFVEMELVRNT